MPTRSGKCANFGLCSKADSGESIVVSDMSDFRCPECKKELRPASGASSGGGSSMPKIMAIAALGVVIVAAGWYLLHRSSSRSQPVASPSVPFTDAKLKTTILRLHGSNTIGAQLGPDLAQAYLRDRGASNVTYIANGTEGGTVIGTLPGQDAPVGIEIQAKGSTTAFTDLGSGLADVGMASRKIKPEEKQKLASLGDLEAFGAEYVIGLDGIAIIVHPSNPISNLTRDQARRIFSGEITDWKDVGGTPGEIHIFSRPPATSGTYETFNNLVLSPGKLAASAKEIDDSAQLSDTVSQDTNAIGYIGLPYIRSAKALGISDHGTRPLIPNSFTVGREDYLLHRRLYLYVPPKRATAEAQAFVRFVSSDAGQAVVDKVGFVAQTVRPVSSQAKADGSAPLNLDFRFRTGSADLDNKALQDLDRVVSYVSSSDKHQGLLLTGYTDNVGAEPFNVALARSRAEAVAEELKRRGLNVVGVVGLGSQNPVASNDTPDGRQQNRRVEIWSKK